MFPALYAILDASSATTIESTLSLAENLIRGGVQLMQLRAKQASSRRIYDLSRALLERLGSSIASASSSVDSKSPECPRVIVNDRPDIAAMAGAAGVHVGQEDFPVEAARAICKCPLWVGVSTHTLSQLLVADGTSVDYIAVGPIFPTGTKQNPGPVVGLDFIRAARKLTRKPLVAIGGITVQSAAEVFRAGADSVAVVGDLSSAPDPAQRAGEYLAIARVNRRIPR